MENLRFYTRKDVRRAVPFAVKLEGAGTTEADYKAGRWIELSEAQAAFYRQNPRAVFSEFMGMEIVPPLPIPEIPIAEQYRYLVINKIRAEYSIDDEFSIHRRRDVDAEKFAEYDAFCERCKVEAKQELGML